MKCTCLYFYIALLMSFAHAMEDDLSKPNNNNTLHFNSPENSGYTSLESTPRQGEQSSMPLSYQENTSRSQPVQIDFQNATIKTVQIINVFTNQVADISAPETEKFVEKETDIRELLCNENDTLEIENELGKIHIAAQKNLKNVLIAATTFSLPSVAGKLHMHIQKQDSFIKIKPSAITDKSFLSYDIQVPNFPLHKVIHNKNAAVSVSDGKGNLTISTTNAPIIIENHKGTKEVHALNGKATIRE